MIDPEKTLRAYLAARLTGTFGSRVYAGRNLPDGYKISDGPAVLFATRSGMQEFHSQTWWASMTLRIYAATEAAARSAAEDVFEEINDQQDGKLIYMRMEDGTLPTLLRETDTNWPFVLMYVRIYVRE